MHSSLTGHTAVAATPGQPSKMPRLLALLASRLCLFLLFQALIALFLHSWTKSEGYWLLAATLANIVSIIVLVSLFRSEGRRYLSLFRFERLTFRKDIRVFLLLALLTGPVAMGPNYLLCRWLWIDPAIPYEMMFRPVETWLAIFMLLAFPVTIALAELATYFGYVMPHMKGEMRSAWTAVLLPVLFLSLQHITLPFIPDIRFIIYRGLVFLPFAALIGIALHRRPSLFPYFAILHGFMDFDTAVIFLTL